MLRLAPMGSIQNIVHYCCVSKGNRTLYEYSGGDHETENLAALCLERIPQFHKWYFETIRKKTFGFLIEDGYVYFTVVDEGLENHGVLQFLEHMRDEFKKVARKGSRGSFSGTSSIGIQEQLLPVILRLITSLEHVSYSGNDWKAEAPSSGHAGLSPSPSDANVQLEATSSTKAPLLGKSSKQEKKKLKDHVIAVRDIELEEHRKSTDRGVKVDSTALDSNNQSGASSSISLQKDLGSMRIRSVSQNIRKKWWRHVRIVLAIDAAVCLLLFVIWLSICKGIECTRS
ncbi:phytolongin Phyl1.1-like isoform X2 [Durio zibethinus]|uniref:Phytolongin Phyl1.1-like isoform X2 n=1 Tax=Durio zibethinus TaxID=66656 RepID=A0A6P5XFX6_DURZI|nr:phytolongin Phyl1.1-like isoform X2 [Durio zibethinus]